MELFYTYDAAKAMLPPYVITPADAAELAKLQQSYEFWQRKSVWNGDDGFSMSEFLAPAAMDDARKQIERILDGGLGIFLVLVRLEDRAIVATKPEEHGAYGRPWSTELKWVLRREGRMFKDASGRWSVYPYRPKRPSTLAKHGLAERWVIAPFRLVGRGETIGEAMKRGTAQSTLVRRPAIEVAA